MKVTLFNEFGPILIYKSAIANKNIFLLAIYTFKSCHAYTETLIQLRKNTNEGCVSLHGP